jgi:YspA, cpYpsA-related SLOG family
MIVIVTGSRDFAHRGVVRRELLAVGRAAGHLTLRVGDCRTGADLFARALAADAEERNLGFSVDLEEYEANWKAFGVAAGPMRNARMVGVGPVPDRCLAFYAPPPALNRGTSGCVALAHDAGIEVWEFCRIRPWEDVVIGDTVRGADGLEWTVDDAGRGADFTLSHAGRTVSGRPSLAMPVEVIARGELGRAIDNLAAVGLQAEVIDTGRRN